MAEANPDTAYKGSAGIEHEAKRLRLMAEIANPESERVLGKIKESGFSPNVIVDFGCGTGDAFSVFESTFPNASIVGLDQSERAIALARKEHDKAKLFTMDMTNAEAFGALLNQLGRIDLAHIRSTLLHLPDPIRTLGNIKKYLSTNGILFVQEPNWDSAEANWDDFKLFKTAFMEMMREAHINPNMGKEMKAILEKLGLQNIHTDISTKKVVSNDPLWEILNQFIDVGGERLAPFLRKRGIANIKEMRKRIELARTPNNYFITPAWVIAWGTASCPPSESPQAPNARQQSLKQAV